MRVNLDKQRALQTKSRRSRDRKVNIAFSMEFPMASEFHLFTIFGHAWPSLLLLELCLVEASKGYSLLVVRVSDSLQWALGHVGSSNCSPWAQLSIYVDLPRPEIEPMSPH